MPRLVNSWVDGYLEYTSALRTTDLYRKWTAYSCIAGALQRRVYVWIDGLKCRANLYVLLVGPPATGKSNALKIAADEFLSNISCLHLAPTDCSKEAFYGVIEGAVGMYHEDGETQQQCSVVGFFSEWASFLKPRDEQFMTLLSDVFDNPRKQEYLTKTSGVNHIDYPNLTMAGGITMAQLRDRFNEKTLEAGLPSRIVMVYQDGDDRVKVPPGLHRHGVLEADDEGKALLRKQKDDLRKALLHDLEAVTLIEGEYTWDSQAADEAEAWMAADMEPRPNDPRLSHYSERRTVQFMKLCMIHAAMRHDKTQISSQDVNDARKALLEVETKMPYAVSALGANEHYQQLKLARQIVIDYKNLYKRACPEHILIQRLYDTVPLHLMNMLLDQLVRMRWARQTGDPIRFKLYEPWED